VPWTPEDPGVGRERDTIFASEGGSLEAPLIKVLPPAVTHGH